MSRPTLLERLEEVTRRLDEMIDELRKEAAEVEREKGIDAGGVDQHTD